jgi:hypothetical protein
MTDAVNNKDYDDCGDLAALGVVRIIIKQIQDTAAVLKETFECSIEGTHTATRTIVGLCKLLDEIIDRYETLRLGVAVRSQRVKEEAIEYVSADNENNTEWK